MPLLRNADRAIIEEQKLRDYLLNPDHERNNGKWRLFAALGYTQRNWERMAEDLREQHHTQECEFSRVTVHGDNYTIVAWLQGPLGSANIESVWQFDLGSDVPRLISAYGG